MDTLVISTPPGFVSLALPLLSLSLSLSGGGETETEGGAAEEGTRRIPATERELCGGGRRIVLAPRSRTHLSHI